MDILFSPQFFGYLAAACLIGAYIWQREKKLQGRLGSVQHQYIIRELEDAYDYRYILPFIFAGVFLGINLFLKNGFTIAKENPLGFLLIVGALSSLKVNSGMQFSEVGIGLGHVFEPWENISHIAWSPSKKKDSLLLEIHRKNSRVPYKSNVNILDRKKLDGYFSK
ncbi:MAG TPA: hypothetical protein VEC36_08380, partial [Patescibacteria group bacterium]|nr:hypothetical protein [Patescibacteria group bacterium]